MSKELHRFLMTYADFSEEELKDITGRFSAKLLRKGSYQLRSGDICSDLVFVQKGCLRMYYLRDEMEVSVWFAFPNSSAIEIYSFISEAPSNYFIQAIENTEVLVLSKTELQKLYQLYPKTNVFMRAFWEDVILNLIQRFTALQTDAADKRYLDLLKKPDYFASIPQKYLASFIGVTPTSLSRIRKRIAKGK